MAKDFFLSQQHGTIKGEIVKEFLVKKSRFIAQVAHVSDIAQADEYITAIRKEHWKANHNCTALIIGANAEQQRSSDDGEPSGTAGVPMLEVLRNRNLTDIVAVVTRYFGGVLLGAGGLVRAYSNAVSGALDAAAADGLLVQRRALTLVSFDVPHSDVGRIENAVRDWLAAAGGLLGETSYGARLAEFRVLLPPSAIAEFDAFLSAASSGSLKIHVGAAQVVDI